MLSPNQIKRLLAHCTALHDSHKEGGVDERSHLRNEGWVQALRLVLEQSTYPISDKPLPPEDELPVDEDPRTNCCSAPFTYPGWPDSDMCSECYEHADVWDAVEE